MISPTTKNYMKKVSEIWRRRSYQEKKKGNEVNVESFFFKKIFKPALRNEDSKGIIMLEINNHGITLTTSVNGQPRKS